MLDLADSKNNRFNRTFRIFSNNWSKQQSQTFFAMSQSIEIVAILCSHFVCEPMEQDHRIKILWKIYHITFSEQTQWLVSWAKKLTLCQRSFASKAKSIIFITRKSKILTHSVGVEFGCIHFSE